MNNIINRKKVIKTETRFINSFPPCMISTMCQACLTTEIEYVSN